MEDILQNPFPGLRAFEEHEYKLFFGRAKQVAQLLSKLNTVRLLAVTGSSGSGKSSLVNSGLVPLLHKGLLTGAGTKWKICSFRPGNNPIGNMAKALFIDENALRATDSRLITAYKQSGIDPETNLLILIDEFEEFFRFVRYEKETLTDKRDSIAFIDLLLRAAEQREQPIYIVFTMRSDFLGDCTEFSGLPEAINDGQYLVPRMTQAELTEAITGPARVGGAAISAPLLNQLLNDVGDNPDQLPILQHALMRTWDFWKKKQDGKRTSLEIGLQEYSDIGTMRHALSQHAEEAYAELETPRSQQICEAVFRALTEKGADARGVRRPRELDKLCELANASEDEVAGVIDVFRKKGRGFLMPPSEVPLSGTTIIDISHESIMRVWERLMGWVDEENQSAQIYLRLCDAANLYETGKGGLLRDPELQVDWKWKEENVPNIVWASRYNDLFDKAILFLEHSKAQFEKELVFKEKMQKQHLSRARRVATVISVIALGAFLLAVYSFELRNLAKRQTTIAEKESIEAKRQRKLAQHQERIAQKSKESALLSAKQALEQKRIAEKEQENAYESEKNALLQKVIAEQQKTYAERQKVISDENATIARQQQGIAETQTQRAVSNEKIAIEQKQISARLKDLAEARNLSYQAILLLNDKKFDESKKEVLNAYKLNVTNDGPLQNNDIYTALQFNWVNDIQHKNQFAYHKYPVRSIARGPAAGQMVSLDESGIVYFSKLVNGIPEPVASYDIKDEARSICTSPDGLKAVVVTAAGNAILLRLTANGTSVKESARIFFPGIGRQVVFKNNSEFAILSSKGLGIYRANTTIEIQKFFNGNFTAMSYGSDDKLYLAADNKISIYNDASELTGTPSATFTLPSRITSIAVSPADSYLAAGTYEGGIWIKEMKSNKPVSSFTPHASSINDLKFSMVGGGVLQLASASSDQTIKLIDVKALMTSRNTEDILTLRTHNKWVYCLLYTPDGKFLYTGSEDKKIVGWHTTMAGMYRSLTTDKN